MKITIKVVITPKPKDTVPKPITHPALNATRNASYKDSVAINVVLKLAIVAIFIPI